MMIVGFGLQCIAIPKSAYYIEMMTENRSMFKYLCSLFVVKSIRFLKLFGYNKQIAVVTKVIFDSFAFVKDILGIIVIFFFLFGAVGMSMFGGNVNSDTPKLFEEVYGDEPDDVLLGMNFNDYYYAIVTLYTVMLGGWTDVIKVNTVAFGKENNSMVYNAYFIIYFFFVSLCFLNTLFGFLVDNVAANLDATIAEEDGEAAEKASVSQADNEGEDDEGDEGDKKAKLGDLRDDLDEFIDLKDKEGEDDEAKEKDNDDGEESKQSFKKEEAYDPVDKVIEKIDA
jgi:hypothetical protein